VGCDYEVDVFVVSCDKCWMEFGGVSLISLVVRLVNLTLIVGGIDYVGVSLALCA